MGADYRMIDGDKEDKICTRDQSDCTDVGGIMDEMEVCILKLIIHHLINKNEYIFSKLIIGTNGRMVLLFK